MRGFASWRGPVGRSAFAGTHSLPTMFIVALVGSLVLTLLPALTEAAHAARSVTVSFRIDHVNQIENPDTAAGDGDYFPRVKIEGTAETGAPFESRPIIEDDSFSPGWLFTRTVSVPDSLDPNDPNVFIEVQLIDHDTGPLEGGDDHMDISPRDHDDDLDLWYNTNSNTFRPAMLGASPLSPTNDVTPNVSYSQGDGDHGFPDDNDGRIAKIDFSIAPGTTTDADGDGIPDSIERLGVRNPDGSMVTDFAALGADPCRQTIAMQLDWMQGAADGHSHQPKPAAISEVQAAFGNAPNHPAASPCPYGAVPAPGIQFIQIPGHGFPEAATMGIDNAYRAQRDASFNPLLGLYAHYAIFAHDQGPGDSSSGLCCDDFRRDPGKGASVPGILVTLGEWEITCVNAGTDGVLDSTKSGDDVVAGTEIDVGPDRNCNSTASGDDTQVIAVGSGAADAEVGSTRDQSGSIMHELGHALGLGHGGINPTNLQDEKTNNKPNYLSVMNYSFDPDGIPVQAAAGAPAIPDRLDYSAQALPNLDKTLLSEAAGIGDGTDITTWKDAAGKTRSGVGNAPLNWSGNKNAAKADIIDPGTVNVNINPQDDAPGAKAQILNGRDDWSFIQFRAVAAPGAGQPSAGHGPDVTFQATLARRLAFQAFWKPDLSITKDDGVTTATPGNSVTYTITAKNNGEAPMVGAKITDTFPSAISADSYTASTTDGATGFTANGSGNISDLVTMPAGSTITYVVHADISPDGTGDLVNKAVIDPPLGTVDKSPTDNQATDSDHLIPIADLKTVKSGPAKVVPGTNVTYTVTVSNAGPSTASDATVTDVVPAGSTFASETHPAGWTCSTPAPGTAGTITCGPARLARQSSATFTFVAHVGITAVGSTLHNSAKASSSAMDPHPDDNQSQQVDTDVKCDNTISSSITGNAKLTSGSWCVVDAQIPGTVTISPGAQAIIVRSTIGGSINGQSPGLFAICGSNARGAISISGATGYVLVGDPRDDQCPGNTLSGSVNLSSNRAGVEISGNKAAASVTLTGNSGAGPFPEDVRPSVEANTISGALHCSGDVPTATNNGRPNTALAAKSGECAGAAF